MSNFMGSFVKEIIIAFLSYLVCMNVIKMNVIKINVLNIV